MSNRDYYFIPEEIGKLKQHNAEMISDNKYEIRENGLVVTVEKVNGQHVVSITDKMKYFTGTASNVKMDVAFSEAMKNYQYQTRHIRLALAGCEIGIQQIRDREYCELHLS